MSLFTKKGEAAVASAQVSKEAKVSAHVKFNAGTTLKIRFKSATDSVEYYAHNLFSPTVPTFAPKITPERNAKGYITANPSIWDRAATYLYEQADAEKDAKRAEDLRKQAFNFKSKPRYLLGFVNLETGEEGFVDLTKKQADGVFATIKKYAKKLDKVAFELSKTGASTSTVVSLTPLIDMEEDLTEKERANFEKGAGTSFDFEKFEDFVYMADEAEQTKNLVIAGFDIARLGLSIGAAPEAVTPVDSTPISEDDLPF